MMEWMACTRIQHKGLTSQLAQICAYRARLLLIERQQVYSECVFTLQFRCCKSGENDANISCVFLHYFLVDFSLFVVRQYCE